MVPRTCTAASNLFRRTKEGVAAETIQGLLRRELQSIALAVGRRADSNRLPLLQLRVISHALRAFADACKFCMSKGFLCSGLQCVAPYCAPGGIRVVSMSPLHPRNYVIDERNVNPHPITIPIADSFANSHRL